MRIKAVTDKDLQLISELNALQSDFKLSNFDNVIIERLAIESNKVIAYGVVKNMAEAIILVNPNVPKITRAAALAELMQYAEFGASKAGINQLHCFVKDEKLARLLEKKFDFIRTKDIVLVKNLD
jgi:hypothetical protein